MSIVQLFLYHRFLVQVFRVTSPAKSDPSSRKSTIWIWGQHARLSDPRGVPSIMPSKSVLLRLFHSRHITLHGLHAIVQGPNGTLTYRQFLSNGELDVDQIGWAFLQSCNLNGMQNRNGAFTRIWSMETVKREISELTECVRGKPLYGFIIGRGALVPTHESFHEEYSEWDLASPEEAIRMAKKHIEASVAPKARQSQGLLSWLFGAFA